MLLNDVHSRLNPTRVARVVRPASVDELRAALETAASREDHISIGGGRHAMGGQPFAEGSTHIDLRGLTAVLGFDPARGLLHIEVGADWPAIISATHSLQANEVRSSGERGSCWGIRQKQTGADSLTLGGAIAANAHGRGLLMSPVGDDIESLEVITLDQNGSSHLHACSRTKNAELFSLVIGGYGLFGVVVSATLRLRPRVVMRRLVDVIDIDDAMNAVYRRVADGCEYGDFQYAIDPTDDSFLRRGVFACYRPDVTGKIPDEEGGLSSEQWLQLVALAHTDKRRAFQVYSAHYLSTHGRTYWSDTMQLSTYVPSYSEFLAASRKDDGTAADESLVIGEMMVPPERLLEFMTRARRVLRTHHAEDIYGTIRSIRRDETSFLAWARDHYACVIFNLRTVHTADGVAKTHATFRALIDAASSLGGTFFLTYSRAATPGQVLACHPRIRQFLRLKRHYDPALRFQSEWYRHYAPALE